MALIGNRYYLAFEMFMEADFLQKRLGQYFTSPALARLLAALSNADTAKSIIDPMAGQGSMLMACKNYGARNAQYGAIEIDESAWTVCHEQAPWSHPILGDAFQLDTFNRLSRQEWDLVITNPPYVRYQSLSKGLRLENPIPSGKEVRENLSKVINSNKNISSEDKRLFQKLVVSYSGLADLAVPSWLLCATLCAPGGKLALILPESWLNRDYAAVVQYLLLRWFRILYVVEDTDIVWFPEVQVKTTILIAERVERRDSAFNYSEQDTYLYLSIAKQCIGEKGLVDKLFENESIDPEREFSELVQELIISGNEIDTKYLKAKQIKLTSMADNLERHSHSQKWLAKMENKSSNFKKSIDSYMLPSAINEWLKENNSSVKLKTFDEWGIKVGQGLRTGANKFFYTDMLSSNDDYTEVTQSPLLTEGSFKIPNSLLLPVIKKQTELPKGFLVTASQLNGRVILIEQHALVEDIEQANAVDFYTPLPEDVSSYIRAIDKVKDKTGRYIRDFSAVIPNIRVANKQKNMPARFWYMLPGLAQRHKPDIFIPRVNNGTPKAFVNLNREAVVDANFSTIWCTIDGPSSFAIMAFLNSSWCSVYFEHSGSVMGGGALKIEATHIRRLPIPSFSSEDWASLSSLGKNLSKNLNRSSETLAEINQNVVTALLGRSASSSECRALENLAIELKNQRQQKNKY